jgi:hypothetical protein
MDARCWVVTGPKALAPRASGPRHIPGLKSREGSMLGPGVLSQCGVMCPRRGHALGGVRDSGEPAVRAPCGLH